LSKSKPIFKNAPNELAVVVTLLIDIRGMLGSDFDLDTDRIPEPFQTHAKAIPRLDHDLCLPL
jgi:hypothetical protein